MSRNRYLVASSFVVVFALLGTAFVALSGPARADVRPTHSPDASREALVPNGNIAAPNSHVSPAPKTPAEVRAWVETLGLPRMKLALMSDEIARAHEEATGGGGGIVPDDADEVAIHKADQAHALGFKGSGVRVAVIDTGLDFVHPDLFNATFRVMDPTSPYFLHPVAYDGASMNEYLFFGAPAPTLPFGVEPYPRSWWIDTSYSTPVVKRLDKPDQTRWVNWTDGVTTLSWNVTGVSGLSLGEEVRIGFHPDDKLLALWGMRPGVLLFNHAGAGAPYDHVLVDLDADMSFVGEKHNFINTNWASFDPKAELISKDINSDGVPDLSGGMLYFISDGVREIPYLRRQIDVANFFFRTLLNDETFDVWAFLEVDPTAHLVPAAGDVTLLFGDFDDPGLSGAGSHGTWVASAIAGQGITGGGSAGPVLQGMAPNVKLIGAGNNFEFPSTDPFGFVQLGLWTAVVFATEGYDGTVGTGDEAHIASNSWGGAEFTGWEFGARFVDYVSAVHSNGRTAFVFSAGNSGPGYGGRQSPAGGASLIVSGAMNNFNYRVDPFLPGFPADGGPNPAWGDVASFSNRGPSALGRHYIDALTSGFAGYGADPLNDNPFISDSGSVINGKSSWILWAGTSLSTPNLSGIVALIYDAYMKAHGAAPTASTAKTILKNSADDVHQDPFLAGPGVANALRAVRLASEMDGLTLSVDEWNPGDYRGAVFPAYANLLAPGGTRTASVAVTNHRPTGSLTVNVESAMVANAGSISFGFTRIPFTPANQYLLTNAGLLATTGAVLVPETTGLFAAADAIRVSMWFDSSRLPEFPIYLLDIHDWTDVNLNGAFNGFTERNLMFRDYISYGPDKGPNGFGFVYQPDTRAHDGLVLRVNPLFEGGLVAPVDFSLRVDYYHRVPFPWLTVTPPSLTIPAASQRSVGLTVTVPSTAEPGLYEAVVLFRLDDGNVTTLPVITNVAMALSSNVPASLLGLFPPYTYGAELYGRFGGNTYDAGPYAQGVQHGQGGLEFFDDGSGDFRYYFLDLPRNDFTFAFVSLEWDDPNSVNEIWVLTNVTDWFSGTLPARYGPGTQDDASFSFGQVGNTTLAVAFLNAGLSIVAIRSTFLAGTAVEEHPRGVIVINLGPAFSNEKPVAGGLINDASPTVSVDMRDPAGIYFVIPFIDGIYVPGTVTQLFSKASLRLDLPFKLEEGTHVVTVEAYDNYFAINIMTWEFTVDTIPPNLVITSPATALTNNRAVTITGTTEPGATVTIDGNPVTVDANGAFTRAQTLSDGTRSFVVVATDQAGNARSVVVTITVDATGPALTLSSPNNGAVLDVPTVTVAGTTEAGARLVVNGVVAAVSSDGSFSFKLALAEGANVIAANATDAAGNSATVSVTVTYVNPVPGLRSELEATKNSLNATQGTLTNTRSALDGSNANLATLATQALIGLLVVVLVLAAMMSLLYWNLNKKIRGMTPPPKPPQEEEL